MKSIFKTGETYETRNGEYTAKILGGMAYSNRLIARYEPKLGTENALNEWIEYVTYDGKICDKEDGQGAGKILTNSYYRGFWLVEPKKVSKKYAKVYQGHKSIGDTNFTGDTWVTQLEDSPNSKNIVFDKKWEKLLGLLEFAVETDSRGQHRVKDVKFSNDR